MLALYYDIHPLRWLACQCVKRAWRGVLRTRLNGLTLRDAPPPELPGDDWVRVRTRMAGICGTDVALLAQKQPPDSILQAFSSFPAVLGHENLATVESVGPAVDGAWVGKRVTVEPTLGCVARGIEPPCPRCAAGEFGACENFGDRGTGRYRIPPGTSIGYNARTGGGYAEGFVAHVSQLVEVPAGIPDELAVLTDPLACSLHTVLRTDLRDAGRVAVYGVGMLGLGIVASLRAMGYAGEVHALGRSRLLGERAGALGASHVVALPEGAGARFARVAELTGTTVHRARFGNRRLAGGYDVVYDCVGSPRSMTESLKWTRPRGQVALVGTGAGGRVELTSLWFRELTFLGAYGRQVERVDGRAIGTYDLVHELMAGGRLPVGDLLTHTFPLRQYAGAFDAAMDKRRSRAIKVAFDFREG